MKERKGLCKSCEGNFGIDVIKKAADSQIMFFKRIICESAALI